MKGEIHSLARQFEWGPEKVRALDELLRELPAAEIGSEMVLQAYARLDHESRKLGRRMGKNDLWIAAIALVQRAVLLTTDRDFDHLHPDLVNVERVDVNAFLNPASS